MQIPCLLSAWSSVQEELHGYLLRRMNNDEDADDMLHEVFLKALRQGSRFCAVNNSRAWLFQVTRNALADKLRITREEVPMPAKYEIALADNEERAPVEDLSQCLPRVLSELSEEDRLAITLCDIEGESQQVLADRLDISLPGAKSRVQRARQRLKKRLVEACQVRFDESGEVCCFTPRPIK